MVLPPPLYSTLPLGPSYILELDSSDAGLRFEHEGPLGGSPPLYPPPCSVYILELDSSQLKCQPQTHWILERGLMLSALSPRDS